MPCYTSAFSNYFNFRRVITNKVYRPFTLCSRKSPVCAVCLACTCNLLFLVWFGLVWMRQGSILINTTCAGGELYIKLVCRLTQATCCGFMCVWDGSAGLSDPDSSLEDTLGRIHKSFDQLGPSVEPKLLSQRVGFCDVQHFLQK